MSGTLVPRGRSAYGMDSPRYVDWRRLALCRTDPDAWSVFGTKRLDTANVMAVRTCRRCPVLRECDAWASTQTLTGVIAAGKVWLSPETGGVPVVDATCQWCGRVFPSIGPATQCGRDCRVGRSVRHARDTVTKTCDVCGTVFQTTSAGQRYCASKCNSAAWRRRVKAAAVDER